MIARAGISPRRQNREEALLLVTNAYTNESTYSWNIQSVCQKKNLDLLQQGWGREESVGNDYVSIVCARKYEIVRMT